MNAHTQAPSDASKETSIEMAADLYANRAKSQHESTWYTGDGNGKHGPNRVAVEEADAERHASRSSSADAANMRRMGRDQELIRNFRTFSVASFAAVATAIWEFSIFQITPALIDGGSPNLLYSTIWNFIGFGPIYLSMAEMASMAPIAGAQYHWVSEFAPESMQKVLSYVSG